MVDHSNMRLGKLAPRLPANVLRLSKMMAALPSAPPSICYSAKVTALGMMRNDTLSDCTCAAAGHAIQVWSANVGQEVTVSDDVVVKLYEATCGYNPADPSTDQGGVEQDVIDYWLKNPVDGHTLAGAVPVKPADHAEVKTGAWLFGGLYIGLALPISAQTQDVWDVPTTGLLGDGAPGSWGGHAVSVPDYDADGLTCITWGARKRMTWAFWDAYCDEAHGLIGKDWIGKSGVSPPGFDLPTLLQDSASI